MEWLGSNWIWLALGVGTLALFVFGRGGCGMGHRGHGDDRRIEGSDQFDHHRDTTLPLATPAPKLASDDLIPSGGHAHPTPLVNQGTLAAGHAGHDSGAGQAEHQRHRHGC